MRSWHFHCIKDNNSLSLQSQNNTKMKKPLLLIISCFSAASFSLAQITLNNVTTQYYAPDNTIPVEAHLDVINNNSTPVDINVVRTVGAFTNGHSELFCFGLYCYTPFTDSSASPTTVAPGATESTFKPIVDPMGLDGYDRLHYLFYDASNPADSVGVTLEFFFGATSIDETENASYLKFNNEVNNFTVLNYKLPAGAKNAKITVHNMLGSILKNISIDEKQGMKVLSTSDLSNGMYLVSLVVNGKVDHSYRMIVNHNKGN
jgi:hypothetical protein